MRFKIERLIVVAVLTIIWFFVTTMGFKGIVNTLQLNKEKPVAIMEVVNTQDNATELVVEVPQEETKPVVTEESHEEKIARLVKDVESGKAGNGKARVEYLGEDFDEVQKIINEKYPKVQSSSSQNVPIATTGAKTEYQAYARDLVLNIYSWSEADFNALVILWERESEWNPSSHNPSSGAHGIPQSLPASKMASEGDDYYTNGYTQIRWGLKYIQQRYENPSRALEHSNNVGWY